MPTSVPDKQLADLRDAAVRAAANAWCPYSRFAVGAALLAEDNRIFGGCNVENASSGLTICAERNAVFQAVAQGQRRFQAMVVYTPTDTPTPPCGACRQVLAEFGPDFEFISVCEGPGILRSRVSDLLPFSFTADQLASGVS